MVWHKELAKLKKDLKAQEANLPVTQAPPLKPVPQPAMPKTLDEEDALFLAAVGKAGITPPKSLGGTEGLNEFEEAMSQFKVVKPKPFAASVPTKTPFIKQPPPSEEMAESKAAPPHQGEEAALNAEPPLEMGSAASGTPESNDVAEKIKVSPEKIQLAAGMTIEVDGQLDLRNHNLEDARERLKERVLDGVCLGWRSLHVILGNSEQLNQVLIDYINSPQSHPLTKYAQAPVPMGGAQAWVLYYS